MNGEDPRSKCRLNWPEATRNEWKFLGRRGSDGDRTDRSRGMYGKEVCGTKERLESKAMNLEILLQLALSMN